MPPRSNINSPTIVSGCVRTTWRASANCCCPPSRSSSPAARRHTDWIQQTTAVTAEHERALRARSHWKERNKTGIHADPHAYFAEIHPGEGMPWFIGPLTKWYARLTQGGRHGKALQADGRLG